MAAEPDYFLIGQQMAATSRMAQGLPPTIEDPATIARIAQLLAPVDLDAGGIKPGAAPVRRRVNRDAVDERAGELAGPIGPAGGDGIRDALTGSEEADRFPSRPSGDFPLNAGNPVVNRAGSLHEFAA